MYTETIKSKPSAYSHYLKLLKKHFPYKMGRDISSKRMKFYDKISKIENSNALTFYNEKDSITILFANKEKEYSLISIVLSENGTIKNGKYYEGEFFCSKQYSPKEFKERMRHIIIGTSVIQKLGIFNTHVLFLLFQKSFNFKLSEDSYFVNQYKNWQKINKKEEGVKLKKGIIDVKKAEIDYNNVRQKMDDYITTKKNMLGISKLEEEISTKKSLLNVEIRNLEVSLGIDVKYKTLETKKKNLEIIKKEYKRLMSEHLYGLAQSLKKNKKEQI